MARERGFERRRLAQARESYGKSWRELNPRQRKTVLANLEAKELGYPSARTMRRRRSEGKVSPTDHKWWSRPGIQGRRVFHIGTVERNGVRIPDPDAVERLRRDLTRDYPRRLATINVHFVNGDWRTVADQGNRETWSTAGLIAGGLAGPWARIMAMYPGRHGGVDFLDVVVEAAGAAGALGAAA
jgi:hypothetical protein